MINNLSSCVSWLIFFSIIGLILTFFLPWVSIHENDQGKEKMLFNFEMMKDSNDVNLNYLSEKVELVHLAFASILVFSLFSFLGMMMFYSERFKTLGQIFLSIGGILIAVSSFLTIFHSINFVRNVNNFETISVSNVTLVMNHPFILQLVGLACLILALYYNLNVAGYSIDYFQDNFRKQTGEKEDIKTAEVEPITSGEIKNAKQFEFKNQDSRSQPTKRTNAKTMEIEKWLNEMVKKQSQNAVYRSPEEKTNEIDTSVGKKDNEEIKDEVEDNIEEIDVSSEGDYSNSDSYEPDDRKTKKSVFETGNKKETLTTEIDKEKSSEKTDGKSYPSKSLDEVLSYAIEKRNLGKKQKKEIVQQKEDAKKKKNAKIVEKPEKEEQDNTPKEKKSYDPKQYQKPEGSKKQDSAKPGINEKDKKSETKTMKIRCPQCNQVFSIEKTDTIDKIKCPKCGYESDIQL